jgi:hypothetical protein
MAVSRYRSPQSGIITPESIPTTPMKTNSNEENVREESLFDKIEFILFII